MLSAKKSFEVEGSRRQVQGLRMKDWSSIKKTNPKKSFFKEKPMIGV